MVGNDDAAPVVALCAAEVAVKPVYRAVIAMAICGASVAAHHFGDSPLVVIGYYLVMCVPLVVVMIAVVSRGRAKRRKPQKPETF